MKKRRNYLIGKAMIALVMTAGLYSCESSDDNQVIGIDQRTVKVGNSEKFGKILMDKNGASLYFFSKDHQGKSACVSGDCPETWPVFYTEDLSKIDHSLNAADFASIKREDGKMQTTYKGWPLYYFKNDNQPGSTAGDKVNDLWYIAKPDYTVMYTSAQLIGEDGKNYVSTEADTLKVGDGNTFYLTDAYGKTLYKFTKDKKDTNMFTEEDLSNNNEWPMAELENMKVPSILSEADFGTITTHGKTQLTFKGWPMYYYGKDMNRGDNKGVSVPTPGIWPIVNTQTSIAL